jgi:hydrogenase maturation factor
MLGAYTYVDVSFDREHPASSFHDKAKIGDYVADCLIHTGCAVVTWEPDKKRVRIEMTTTKAVARGEVG